MNIVSFACRPFTYAITFVKQSREPGNEGVFCMQVWTFIGSSVRAGRTAGAAGPGHAGRAAAPRRRFRRLQQARRARHRATPWRGTLAQGHSQRH